MCTEMCEPAGSSPDALAGSHTAQRTPSSTEPVMTPTDSQSSDDIALSSPQSVVVKKCPTDSPWAALA